MADKNLSLGTIFTGEVDKKFQNAVRDLLAITRALNKQMGKQRDVLKGTSTAWRQYGTAVDQASIATKRASKQHEVINKQIAKVQGAWNRMKAAMKVTAAYALAATALFKIVEGLKAGAEEVINFDQALRNLQAISGATEAEVSVMGDTIKDVARVTKFSTTEVAEGMVLLTQAGFSAAEATAAIKSVSQLATGTLSNMKTVADLVTSSVRAFGLEATEASRVADIMANAINRSKLTIDKLRISFNYIGAVAAQTGLVLEETAATMMVLANNGLRASTIGTGMRQVLSRLMAPTAKLREAFASHNIELDKVNPRMVGYQNAMKALLPVMWDTEKGTVDMTKAFELFGLRGAQAAAVLVRAFAGTGFDEMLEKVYEVGAAEAMASIQAEGLALKFKNLADRMKIVAVTIGEGGAAGALGVLLDALKKVSQAMEWLAKTAMAPWFISFPAWILMIWGATKALKGLWWVIRWFWRLSGLLPVVMNFGYHLRLIGIAAKGAATGIITFKVALRAAVAEMGVFLAFLTVANPWRLVIVGIAAVVTYLTLLSRKFRKHREDLEKAVVQQQSVTDSLMQYRKALGDLYTRMEKGEEVTDQYQATLKRLAKDHKELAGRVIDTTITHEELMEVLATSSFVEFHETAKKSAAVLGQYQEDLFDLASEWREAVSSIDAADMGKSVKELGVSFEDFLKTTKRGTALFAKQKVELNRIAAGYALWIDKGLISKHTAEGLIEVILEENNALELQAEILDLLAEHYERLQRAKEKVDVGRIDFKEIEDEFGDFYETLTSMQQTQAILEIDRALKSAEAEAKILTNRLTNAKDIAEKRGAVFGKYLAEVKAKLVEEFNLHKVQGEKLKTLQVKGLEEYVDVVKGQYGEEKKVLIDVYKKKLEDVDTAQANEIKNLKKGEGNKADILMKYHARRERISGEMFDKLNNMSEQFYGKEQGIWKAIEEIKFGDPEKGIKRKYDSEKKYYSLMAKLRKDELEKVKADNKKTEDEIDEWRTRSLEGAKGNAEEIKEINEKYLNLMLEAGDKYAASRLKVDTKLKVERLKIIRDTALAEIAERRVAADPAELGALKVEEKKVHEDYTKGVRKLYQVFYDNLMNMLGKDHSLTVKAQEALAKAIKAVWDAIFGTMDADKARQRAEYAKLIAAERQYTEEWFRLHKEMYDKALIEQEEWNSIQKSFWGYWVVEHEKAWKRGEISVEKYMATLKSAMESTAITLEVFKEKTIRATGTFEEAWEFGLERAKEKIQSWQDVVIEISENFADKFAGGITQGLFDFIDGTKSAEQAWQDFARSMLRWMGEMIIKLTLMKAIMKIMGLGGGGDLGPLERGLGWASGYRKGGIVGKGGTPVRITNPNVFANAQSFQGGGMVKGAGEVPIMAHAGEGVFTPEQMQALGGQIIELTTINVQDFKMLDRVLSTSQGKGAMINFIGSNAPMIKRIIG